MDYIMNEFSGTIRKLAGSDRIIAARSAPGYIQMVLAPEVATLLVMEDMSVDEKQARAVMLESADLGDLLHGKEEGDQSLLVPRDNEEDDEDVEGDYWTKTQRVF
jgi:hypothetical protein